ncbi:cell division protein FtsK [Escherichia coli]|uniref:cell division protein FtsK n=1 Tax=Escherichia coli TaxID=562 RepID=UPI0021124482|nr:cell division protein FtsK [Escherichia coli]MCQ6880863.1 cell division protein FtsK [Escherichia coli]
MFKSFLNWLGAWLLATLFVFLAVAAVIVVIMLGAIFITWSLPEFNDIGNILFAARSLLAVSAFVGFCWTAAPDWDAPF